MTFTTVSLVTGMISVWSKIGRGLFVFDDFHGDFPTNWCDFSLVRDLQISVYVDLMIFTATSLRTGMMSVWSKMRKGMFMSCNFYSDFFTSWCDFSLVRDSQISVTLIWWSSQQLLYKLVRSQSGQRLSGQHALWSLMWWFWWRLSHMLFLVKDSPCSL